MNWLRLWNDMLSDRKLRRLPPAQRWLWVALLILARQSPQPGKLYLSDGVLVRPEDLPDIAAVTARQVADGLSAFEEQGMIVMEGEVIVIKNWEKRQPARDQSRDRMRESRARHSAAAGDTDVTPPDNRVQRQSSASVDHLSDDLPQPAPSAPSVCRDAFFRAEKTNGQVAAVIDFWRVPLSEDQRAHLGKLLKRVGHGQEVWSAVKASTDAADPVQFMERMLQNEEARRSHAWGGRQEGAVPTGGAEGFSSVSRAEVRAALKAKADEAAGAGEGASPG